MAAISLYADSTALDFPELESDSPADVVRVIRQGLPTEHFDALQEALDVTTRDLAQIVGITQSTLSRRRQHGPFNADESERIVRIARLFNHAVRAMESKETARKWLKEPARALGGESPLRFADTEPGAREVERLLTRLEHGVFS